MDLFSTKEIILQSSIKFGTSGARGLVEDFLDSVIQAYVVNFVAVLRRKINIQTVAIAIDNRPSSYEIALNCANALQSQGVNYVYYGVIPTPALANQAFIEKMPAIMVTGSHIPFDRNGLKFYTNTGEITKQEEQDIIATDVEFRLEKNISSLEVSSAAEVNYISRYTDFFPEHCLDGLRIGIYEHSSAGRDLYKKIFESLGATVVSLGRTENFVSIDTEAVSEEDKQKARLWKIEHNLDALFSTDGDGDRPLLTDENGEWLRGDVLCILCAMALNIKAVATPISSNTLVSKCGKFSDVVLTKIGSPYVIDALKSLLHKYDSVAGFEANGGFILSSAVYNEFGSISALPTRDSVLPVLTVLANYRRDGISQIVNSLPQRFTYSDRIQNFPVETSQYLIDLGLTEPHKLIDIIKLNKDIISIDHTDGVRITFSDSSIVHLRPSGNAPELRIYAETSTQNESINYVVGCKEHIVLFAIA